MAGVFPNSGVPANQALNSTDVPTTNCGGDAGELFHSTSRCTPRFDPASANAVISEILNAIACSGRPYDCDRLDNLCRAIRNIALEHVLDNLNNECLDLNPIDFSGFCGNPRQLILVQQGGCTRLATFTSDSLLRDTATWGQLATHLPPDTTGFNIPDDFNNPTNYYNLPDFQADYVANTLAGARIANSRILRFVFSNPCERRHRVDYRLGFSNPNDVEEAYRQRMRLTYRWRVDGGPWNYNVSSLGIPQAFVSYNAVNPIVDDFTIVTLPPGNIIFEIFYLAEQPGHPTTPPVRLISNTFVPGSPGAGTPRGTISQEV